MNDFILKIILLILLFIGVYQIGKQVMNFLQKSGQISLAPMLRF